VAGYYERVAGVMLPHLIDRPLTLERYPRGVDEPGFMQKNAGKGFPDFIRRIELPKQDGTVAYPAISDEEGLMYLVNQNTITFHIPCFRSADLEHPDRLVFDLDPDEGDVEGARFGAQAVADLLAGLGIDSWLMTTGSKGFHVVAPLAPTVDFEGLARLAQAMALLLVDSHPDRLTIEFLKRERKGRVFLDWLRNHMGATGVCPYSLRPKSGAPIAMPISWKDLEQVEPNGFRLADEPNRRRPWQSATPQDLAPAVAAIDQMIEDGRLELTPFDRFGR
jgi:bifunctional non-homologous end joining protein LigD